MESEVRMTLEEYTALIKENILLKNKLDGLKRQARQNVDEKIKDSLINNLDKESTIKWLAENDQKKLLKEFTADYSWYWEEIARASYVLTAEDVKHLVVEEIHSMLNSHLQDIQYKEQEQQNA